VTFIPDGQMATEFSKMRSLLDEIRQEVWQRTGQARWMPENTMFNGTIRPGPMFPMTDEFILPTLRYMLDERDKFMALAYEQLMCETKPIIVERPAVEKAMAREQPETGVWDLEYRGDLRHD